MSVSRRLARLAAAIALAAVSLTCNGDEVTRPTPDESGPSLATTGTPATVAINRSPPLSALDTEVWVPTSQPIVLVKDAGGVPTPGVVVTASLATGTGT